MVIQCIYVIQCMLLLQSAQYGTLVGIVQYFQKLFDVRCLSGVFPAMNSVYRKVQEANSARRNLCEILGEWARGFFLKFDQKMSCDWLLLWALVCVLVGQSVCPMYCTVYVLYYTVCNMYCIYQVYCVYCVYCIYTVCTVGGEACRSWEATVSVTQRIVQSDSTGLLLTLHSQYPHLTTSE